MYHRKLVFIPISLTRQGVPPCRHIDSLLLKVPVEIQNVERGERLTFLPAASLSDESQRGADVLGNHHSLLLLYEETGTRLQV